jgi:selenocysteine lyase/cysteine desulfurase
VESFVGASVALAEIADIGMSEIVAHNLALVGLFRTGVHSIDGLRARDEIGSSIVLVQCDPRLSARIVREYERRRRNVVSVVPVRESTGVETPAYLRFCFHYYHSEKDVLDLIEELESIVAKVT